jgi:CheY-like chemotaxis protein
MSTASNVLIVDDEPKILDLLSRRLAGEGLMVHQASNGVEALAAVRRDHVGIAVMDIKLDVQQDGIQVAAEIQRQKQDVNFIFFTAYDTPAERKRAQDLNLDVVAWIKKGADAIEQAVQAVRTSLGIRFASKVQAHMVLAAREAGVPEEQIKAMYEKFAAFPWVQPPSIRIPPVRPSALPVQIATFEDQIPLLRSFLEQAREGYPDASVRQWAWDRFRHIVVNELWDAVATKDEFRQQLSVQLEQAVSNLDATLLQLAHLGAASLTLERLSSAQISQSDVSACIEAWRETNIDTLPSLHEVLRDWERHYQIDSLDDPDEDPAGDHSPDSPSR